MSGDKIMIVDDEEHIRFLYSEELEDAGYQVVTVSNGRDDLVVE